MSAWRASTNTRFDPSIFRCINNRCDGRRGTRRRSGLQLARRCGWQDLNITTLLKNALRAGKDRIRLRLVLRHSTHNDVESGANQPISDRQPTRPRACLSFMGSLPSFMPDRFLPFLSVVQNRSFLSAKKTVKGPLPPKTDCQHETAKLHAKPCQVQSFTYIVENYVELLTRNITSAEIQGGRWRIISPYRLTLNKCVGHCSSVTNPQRQLVNFFELIGADHSEFTSKCAPTRFSHEWQVLFYARQFAIDAHGNRMVSLVKEKWPMRTVMACGCSSPVAPWSGRLVWTRIYRLCFHFLRHIAWQNKPLYDDSFW